MQKMGLEPTRYCYHRHLKPARLPIPPLLRTNDILSNVGENVNYFFFGCLCQVFVGTFFVFRNSVEKLCVSWALPFNKRVRVWACKIRKPHTHVFVPMSHKVFLRNYGSRIKGHQTPGANYLFYPSLLLTIPLISIHKQFTNYIKFEHRFDTFDFYTKAIS